jgi:hypothetical protein
LNESAQFYLTAPENRRLERAADGKLLVFEIGNPGWAHATYPADLFSYKPANMCKTFAAFRDLLFKAMSALPDS